VELATGGTNVFNNATLFDVRHFADTNGDGLRDTKRVSISDFGAAPSSFNNLSGATVRLAPVVGETVTDATGYYIPTTGIDSRPLEAGYYALGRPGIVQGQFTNLGTFHNAGILDLRGSATGNTLVMTGNPVAGGAAGNGVFISDGGQLLLNTVLNEGVAAGGQTGSFSDVLVVDSTRMGTGATTITIDRREGAGAYTPGNGIELVEVRDKLNSAAGVFTLNGDFTTKSGDQAVIAGAYAYTLFHGGVAADANDGNWYLRSELVPVDPVDPPDPVVPIDPVDPVVPVDPVDPTPPRYHPGAPAYETYPQHLLNLIRVPTMQQRVGNRYWKDPQPAQAPETVFCKDASRNFRCTVTEDQAKYYANGTNGQAVIEDSAIWARIEGGHRHVEPAVSTSGSIYNSNAWKLQAGLDGLLHETEEGGKLIGGINLSYGRAWTDVRSLHGDGDMTTDGYGVGATLTWLDQSGFYVDGQASATWFDSDINSDHVGRLGDGNNGFGYALSVETGKKIELNEVWSLTPQAQLVYSNARFDSFTDPFGTTVSLSDGDSLRGRLGLAAEYQKRWKQENGTVSRFSGYGIANLYNEFLDGTRVNVSGVEFDSRNERLWGGLGLGGSYNWNDDKYSVYGEVSANTGLRHFGDSFDIGGTLGLRVKW
jgi:fibronectin-binding autotransporter adhesin